MTVTTYDCHDLRLSRPTTIATYRWTVDRYHQAVDAGLFDDQSIELLRGDLIVRDLVDGAYKTEDAYKSGCLSPRAFTTIEISVQRLMFPQYAARGR